MDILLNRPRVFDDIVGQDKTVRDMKRCSIELIETQENAYAQNMLFAGPTGTGKTTTALVVASLLNCENPVKQDDGSYQPCLECNSCKDILSGKFSRDVHMLDASTLGKDDVVKIEEYAKLRPMYDHKRIIVIDEAQELSAKAFGATLKLLEKVRDYLHFILCTMDEKSIGKAIKDRCKVYRFYPLTSEALAKHLFSILTEQKIEVPEEFLTDGIFLISEYSEGSIRAGVGNLEKCIKGELFDTESIRKEFGILSEKTLTNIILSLLHYDASVLTHLIDSDNQDTANKLYYVLVQAKAYSLYNDLDLPDWKKNSYSNMIKQESFDALLEAVSKTFQLPYYRPTYFLDNVVSFLKKGVEVPTLHKRRKIVS